MEIQKIICRLCLKVCDSFKAFEENTKDYLYTLLPKISLAAILKPVMCANCAEVLKKCVDFKVAYFGSRNNKIPFANNNESLKLNLIDAPLSRNENSIDGSEEQDICEFCRSPIKNCSTISFSVEQGDVTLETMIDQCFPELDWSTIKRPVVCATCYESLEMCFCFISNCLIVEEKIKKYCERYNISNTDQVALSSLLQPTTGDLTIRDVHDNSVDTIKLEEQFCEDGEYADEKEVIEGSDICKLEQMSYDDCGYIKEELEYENESYLGFKNEEQYTPKNLLACKEESHFDLVKIEEKFCGENLVDMEEQKFLPNEEIEIKSDESDFYRLEDGILPDQEVVTGLHGTRECLVSDFEVVSKPDTKHTSTNKDVSKLRVNQCEYCSFQKEYKYNIKEHLLHKDPLKITAYKCDFCSYETKDIKYLKQHLIVHKGSSEVTMYKCNSCSCHQKREGDIKKHLLKHKNPSEVKMYKCETCSYQTICKGNLNKHLLVHNVPAGTKIYKCDSCPFHSISKGNLMRHLLVHKDSSEVTMYKCDHCEFETKYDFSLRKHLLVHKDPSEVTMYKCDSCSFQTKSKKNLQRHLLVHKNPSEVTMYKCDLCSFETKYRSSLKTHLLVHKDA